MQDHAGQPVSIPPRLARKHHQQTLQSTSTPSSSAGDAGELPTPPPISPITGKASPSLAQCIVDALTAPAGPSSSPVPVSTTTATSASDPLSNHPLWKDEDFMTKTLAMFNHQDNTNGTSSRKNGATTTRPPTAKHRRALYAFRRKIVADPQAHGFSTGSEEPSVAHPDSDDRDSEEVLELLFNDETSETGDSPSAPDQERRLRPKGNRTVWDANEVASKNKRRKRRGAFGTSSQDGGVSDEKGKKRKEGD
ncbi:hypothetical protein CONPUDRAFT_145068 [Coniophora puteana RWD-64-598 SS2]|uniref:Uncharacterized protein n=1 Tax=Coniophora puteana (strain RWD-64-598) TaxID=741705 RepID=A0A5M3MMW7_CONPW|nr:uncharacterized protein CONPUDRAFT_145068 [Coniophora puteana RWD-64-598 SS2]EIW80045.1 hypothetical protein CONPUDRAFT_145068 [Coniophora puteana RWD-64-598 SS2]